MKTDDNAEPQALHQRFADAYGKKRWFRWLVDLSALAAIVWALTAWQARHHVRGPMPALSLRTLDGKTTSLAAIANGKKTLVYVWAPWCTVCKAESQNVDWVHSWLGEHANVISIATGYEETAEVARYAAERAPTYAVYLSDGAIAATLNVESFPTIYFLDESGRVKRSVSGYTTSLGLLWRLMAP
jgi:thiol-disulfide isomerase/thioredoxin